MTPPRPAAAKARARARAEAGLPPWLSAIALLSATILAWLILRGVVPVPASLATAVLVLVLGFSTFWSASSAATARSAPLRPFNLLDALPVACAIAGLALLTAALLGWGAKPLGQLADTVSDFAWGSKEEKSEKSAPADDAGDPETENATTTPTAADWDHRPTPGRPGEPGRPDAPPIILSYQQESDLDAFQSGPVYVRVAALDMPGPLADDWSPAPIEPARLADADDGQADGGINVPGLPAGAAAGAVPFSIFSPTPGEIVPSLQGMVRIDVPVALRSGEGIWSIPPPAASTFRGKARPLVYGNPDLPDPVPESPGGDRQLWTKLPGDQAGERLRVLAESIAPSLPLPDRVAAVPVWLAQRCRYEETMGNPQDLPPLLNFLDFGRTGSCEHFAGAGVLLVRAMGVPARLAFGYAGGTHAPANRTLTFGARDFHAWAEIHLPGAGWTVLECTPPNQGANRPPEILPETPEEPAPAPVPVTQPANTTDRLVFMLGLGLVCFVLAWMSARWRRRRLVGTGKESLIAMVRQPVWFRKFLDASAALGAPRRPGRTTREHLAFLHRARLATPAIEELVAYYHAIRYDGMAPDPRQDQAMEKTVADWLATHRDKAG